MLKELVKFVARFSKRISMGRSLRVVKVVGVRHFQSQEPRRVYDLTVAHEHVFFAEGVLVHNCADAMQYLCLHANPSFSYQMRQRPKVDVKPAGYRYV